MLARGALRNSVRNASKNPGLHSATASSKCSKFTTTCFPKYSISDARSFVFAKPILSRIRPYSSHTTSSKKSTVLADPERSDLFYHLLEPPTHISQSRPVFGLSFVESLGSSYTAESPRIIGYLPAGVAEGEGAEAGLNDFKENPGFRAILHKAIQEGLREGVDDIQNNGALQLQQGWMHINDDRNIPPLGRIGDPDDIIATVLVEDGKILPETYQPMPAYRMCTSDGVLKLTDGLAKKLKEVLQTQH